MTTKPDTSAKFLNQQLARAYARSWPRLVKFPRDDGLSCPHLIRVHDNYLASRHRLLIVGQETSKWHPEGGNGLRSDLGSNPIQTLMDLYEGFALGTRYRSTPFWRWAWRLDQHLNGAARPHGFLWSNLIKMDRQLSDKGARLPPPLEQDVCALGLLQAEIQIAQPEVIVFLTGPRYDERLCQSFDIRLEEVHGFSMRELAKLHLHGLAPEATVFRTYHPAYFQRSRQSALAQRVLDTVVLEARRKKSE